MSCSICRLPFIPGPYSNDPLPEHFPPKGIMSPTVDAYFTRSVGIGLPEVQTVTATFDYCSKNFFCCYDGHRIANVMWESPFGFGNTVWMMHTACANMFFHALGVVDKNSKEDMTLIASIVGVLGRPLAGQDPGRVRHLNYEAVGEKIDLRPFWNRGYQPGGDFFNWKALSQSKYNFLVVRPFIFPRLLDVAPSRTAHFATVEFNNQDRFTTLPIDILHVLLPYLSVSSYLSLVSTCRFLRLHALTSFQPHARRLVLDIPWSLPLPADLELMSPAMVAKVPDREKAPHSADWLLYLSHIHCTNSMRTRRWIWALAERIKDMYFAKRADSPAMDPATPAYKVTREALERAFDLAGREPTPAGECDRQVVAVAW